MKSSESLNKTSKLYQSSQYGAIWFAHDSSSLLDGGTTYRDEAQEACLERGGAHTTNSTCDHYGNIAFFVQYNYTAVHVAPLYQSLADEALVRHATGVSEFNIHATIAPLPITKIEEGFGEAQDAFSAWFLVVLSFPFIAGAFATFIVTERQTKARHLQTVAGVSPASYWLSTYLWDILNYQIPLWITVMLMFAFDVRVLVTSNREVFSGILTILILVSVIALLPVTTVGSLSPDINTFAFSMGQHLQALHIASLTHSHQQAFAICLSSSVLS